MQTDYEQDDIFKIGITSNLRSRISDYRTGNVYEPRLHYYFPCQNIKEIDVDLKKCLEKYNIKREIYQGDIDILKQEIINTINNKFNVKSIAYEPDIKLGDLTQCFCCKKCFYTSKDLFTHYEICSYYKESLNRVENLKKEKLKYSCEYCGTHLSKKCHLYRHYKTCKKKKDYPKTPCFHFGKLLEENDKKELEDENTNKLLEEKEQQIEELKKKVEELTQNKSGSTNNIQNIQNVENATINNYNIYLNAFGEEKIDYITKKIIKQLVSREPLNSVPKLIEHIHFNPEHSENHNIYIPNKKQSFANIYNGEKWVLKNKKAVIEDMTSKAFDIINDNTEDINPSIDKIKEEYDDGDKKIQGRLHNDTELVILNNQNSIKHP